MYNYYIKFYASNEFILYNYLLYKEFTQTSRPRYIYHQKKQFYIILVEMMQLKVGSKQT